MNPKARQFCLRAFFFWRIFMAFDPYRGFGQPETEEERLARLKQQIGFSDEPVQDAQGYWTIGYGRRLNDTPGGSAPQATISEPMAAEELQYFVAQGGDPAARAAREQQVADAGLPGANPAPTSINDPTAQAPTLDSLRFDPNGPGEFGMSIRHPIDAFRANQAANQATAEALAKYGKGNSALGDGEGDAWRHARWNQLMTQAVGAERAKEFGDAHERSVVDPDPNSRLMDLYNNQVGRELPHDPRGHMNPDIALQNALKDGYIRKKPFGR
jgi:hypothetical protein